jgi:hypothetical protein
MQGLLLTLELRRWRSAGRKPVLWWRDDDARQDTPALRRLLALAAETGVPLTVAAIPDGDRSELAAALSAATGVTLVQHGVDHRNRAAEGRGSGEFAAEATNRAIGEALSAGWARLAGLPGAAKIFVPPWNAIHPALPQALAEEGYAGWSAWAQRRAPGVPPRVDAHLDVLRWKGGARFRGESAVLGRLARLLAERRRVGDWDAPIGLLTHHLDHEAATWAFLDRFLRRGDLDWRSLPSLLA